MNTIVSKFGGTSMADAECFQQTFHIISPRSHRQYIILSAPGKRNSSDDKITDLLILAHQRFSEGMNGSPLLAKVISRFEQILRALHLSVDPAILFAQLESDVRHSVDRAASRGEYLCARLFAAYASIPFVDAAELIHFGADGHLLDDRTAHSIRQMAERYPCAVIPGFYGSRPDGSIQTFSRGGSDITGALVAAALHADIYENWTDVDGLMSADPSICPDAVCHPAVSYRQMHMLASFGARILHPCCVEPVRESGIPTVLRNTFSPNKPGTYISDHVHRSVPCICALDGFNAIAIDSLSPESRLIADVLPFERFSQQTSELIALKRIRSDCPGQPVSIVSAYGLSPEKRSQAAHLISAIGEQHTRYGSRYLVSPEHAAEAQRTLHALTVSRIPSNCGASCHPNS